MADQKISELTALTGANVADDDAIAIVDTSATETKKIVFSELKNALDTATGFVRITGDTMTGALDVQSTITSDGLTVDGGYIAVSGASTGLLIEETDTTDLNTWLSNQGGDLRLFTVNDALSVYTKRMEVDHSTGDISFYEDTGTTAKFFWDASAESLGIRTTSSGSAFELNGNGRVLAGNFLQFNRTDNATGAKISNGGAGSGLIFNELNSEGFKFQSNGSDNVVIDSSGNVGIGVTPSSWRSADVALQLGGTAAEYANFVSGGGGVTYGAGWYRDGATNNFKYTFSNISAGRYDYNYTGSNVFSWHQAAAGTAGNDITFSEAMRIDSSGNLLVGTTNNTLYNNTTGGGANILSDGLTTIARETATTSDTVFVLNDTGAGGSIQEFREDGTTVGSIGSRAGAGIYLDSGSGADGLLKSGGTEAYGWSTQYFYPRTDNTSDLGISYLRFQDLYLSGGVYLGGTGSDNLLDDYEEGTWTISFNGGTVSPTNTIGYYTKIGNRVFIQYYSGSTTITGAGGSAYFSGLPFTVATGSFTYQPFYTSHNTFFGGSTSVGIDGYFSQNNTNASFMQLGSTSAVSYTNGSGLYIMLSGFYYAA